MNGTPESLEAAEYPLPTINTANDLHDDRIAKNTVATFDDLEPAEATTHEHHSIEMQDTNPAAINPYLTLPLFSIPNRTFELQRN